VVIKSKKFTDQLRAVSTFVSIRGFICGGLFLELLSYCILCLLFLFFKASAFRWLHLDIFSLAAEYNISLNNTDGCFDLHYLTTTNESKNYFAFVQIIFEKEIVLPKEELRPNFLKICCGLGFAVDFDRKKCVKRTELNPKMSK
jgi:hypothetical protein